MRLIAHRGFAEILPENTVLAVREAARWADAIEVDVRRCGSGELVVFHDATVDRVTAGSGSLHEFTREELAALRVFESDQGIPTLTEVFEAVPTDVLLNVELKEQGLAAEVVDLAAKMGQEIFLSSFQTNCLREAWSAAPAVDRAYLFADDPASALATADNLDCRYLHPKLGCCSPAFIETANDRDFQVNAWTTRDREAAEQLANHGVDGLIADSPEVIGS